MGIDDRVRELARTQRCLLTTEQAMELGLTRSMLQQRTRSGMLCRIAPRVLALGGVPLTDDVIAFGGWLECGGRSALSHATAAAHWGLPGFSILPVHAVRLRDDVFPPVSLATVHTTRVLPDTQIVSVDGLPITTPSRTLFDLAASVHPGRLERLLDWTWSHRLTNWHLMDRTLKELEGRGRTGITIMRELLAERPASYVPPASNLESRFQQLLRDDGQAPMDRQVDVGSQSSWIGRVDFVDRGRKVVVEVQSDLHHTSVSDARDDATRRAAMVESGWTFCEVREFELWHGPQQALRRVRQARSGR